ncbi:MAG: peptidyl-prolyl cis-trans isomerase [Chthoniobacter sp.]
MGGLLLVCATVWMPASRAAGEAADVVATVDGEPIALGEFLLRLNAERAGVYAHFQSLIRVENTDRFWDTKYGGVTPWAFLKAKTLEDLKAIKVQQSAARRAGIVADTGYASFRQRFEAENRRRAAAARTGEVIYGPRRLSEGAFYHQELARTIERLKSYLAENTLHPSEEQVRQYYERNKDRRYRLPDSVSVEVLTWTIGNKSGGEPAESSLRGVQSGARHGKSLAECVAAWLPGASDLRVAMCTINKDTASQYSKTAPALLAAAAVLQAGQVSEIIRSDAGGMIIQCHAREEGGFLSYDHFQPAIRRDCVDEKYQSFVDQLVAEAEMFINKKVYDGISPSMEPVPAAQTICP